MHQCEHMSDGGMTPERRLALLAYLVEHNQSHADELHDLAHGMGEPAAGLVHEAHDLLKQSNEKLSQAMAALQGSKE